MDVQESNFSIEAPDGYRVQGLAWASSVLAKGVVQIVHGRSEHVGRYRAAAQALARAGYRVYAANHRGHGAQARADGTLGDFGPRGFAALVDDMAVVARHLRQQQPGLPLVMFAHSMGSFAAQYFLLEHSALIDGLMLCGTAAIDMRDPRKSGALATQYNEGIANLRTPCDWLSRDPAVVDAYLADPLCGFALTPKSNASIYEHGGRTADPQVYQNVRKTLPLALMTGDRDPVNHFLDWFDPLACRLRGFGFSDVSTYVYGGARHEPLNEINRAEVLVNLTAWCDRVVSVSSV